MTKDDAWPIIQRALEMLNDELPQNERIPVTPNVRLFGSDSSIDSLSLVSVIVDVESEVSEAEGRLVSLSDDKALARDPSPFSTPDTLAHYIAEITAS